MELLNVCREVYKIYFEYGPRSPKKVDYFHNYIALKNALRPLKSFNWFISKSKSSDL